MDLQNQHTLWSALETRRQLSAGAPFANPSPALRTCFSRISAAITASCLHTDNKCIRAAQEARQNAGSTAAMLLLEVTPTLIILIILILTLTQMLTLTLTLTLILTLILTLTLTLTLDLNLNPNPNPNPIPDPN